MARINVEDSLWTDPRLKLLEKLLGNEFAATGALIRFWRLAQEYWVRDRALIPHATYAAYDLPSALIEAGFAEERKGGIYAKGAEEQFNWILMAKEAGKRGGIKSSKNRRNESINSTKKNTNINKEVESTLQPPYSEPTPSLTPLTLTLTPSLTLTHNTNTKKAKNTPSAVEPFQANPVAIWIEAYKKKYGVRYALQKKDFGFLKNAGQVHGAEALAVLFACYLAIDEKLYADAKHPLSLFFRDLQKISHAAQSGIDPSKAKTDWTKIFGDTNGQ